MAKEIISTILDTSFNIFSGILSGRSFPVSLRLHRYIANANSGKSSLPDFVVSERCLIIRKIYLFCEGNTKWLKEHWDLILNEEECLLLLNLLMTVHFQQQTETAAQI